MLDRLAAPLVAAGLRRLNVSLDSLSHTRFAEITHRDALDRDELEALIRRAVDHKELKHRINQRGFVRASRTMTQIGG